MAEIDALLPELRGSLPGATDMMLRRSLRSAVQYMLEKSQAWIEALDPIALQDGVVSYDMGPPSGTTVEAVRTAMMGDLRMEPCATAVDCLVLRDRGGSIRNYAIDPVTGELLLAGTPTSDDVGKVITVTAVLVTTRDARTIPDYLYQRLHLGIVCAARAEMMALHPSQAWYNPKAAVTQRAIADQYAQTAKKVQVGGNHTPQHVRQRPFA